MAMEISSAQNARIKHLLALQQKSQLRRSEGLFVVEGQRELEHCLAAGYQVESLYVNQVLMAGLEAGAGQIGDALRLADDRSSLFTLPASLYERVAYRGSTEGIIAIVHERRHTLADLKLSAQPLIVVLERVEKPGNLGAVLRSADAAQADAVVVCDPLTDLYNPNLIRSSIGAIFTVPTVACTSQECIDFLQRHDMQILTAQLQDSSLYYDVDMRRPTALVMGTESTGLTQQWRQAATAHIRIPMLGQLDSLNVSVSAAILLFEAVRQRQMAAV
ncbi:MAG: RNA methyltransferase [Prevotella sp.]|nr:RNA methyltransferase [Prevotella sp.]